MLHDFRADFRRGRTGDGLRVNMETKAYAASLYDADNFMVQADGRLVRRWGTSIVASLAGRARLEEWSYADPDASRFLLIFEAGSLIIRDMTGATRATLAGPWDASTMWFMTLAHEGTRMFIADATFATQIVSFDVAAGTFSIAPLAFDDADGRLRAPFFGFADKDVIATPTIHTAAGQQTGYGAHIATALAIDSADFDLTLGTGKLSTSAPFFGALHAGTRLRIGAGELRVDTVTDAQNASITVLRDLAVRLDPNPFFIRQNSAVVEVAARDHGLAVGDPVFFYGLSTATGDKSSTVLTNAVTFGGTTSPAGGAATYAVTRVVGPHAFEITGNASITDPDSLHGGSDVYMIPKAGYARILEPAMSDLHGWPQAVGVHESRLWLGGTDELPDAAWASHPFSFTDFDPGDGNPDEAITMYGIGQQARVRHFLSTFDLIVLCDNGAFYTPGSTDTAITPETARAPLAAKVGAAFTAPQHFDGATFYLDAPGVHVRELALQNARTGYNVTPASVVVPDWIAGPKHSTAYKGSAGAATPYLIWGNDSDGALVVMHSSRSDESFGFMRWTLGVGTFVCAGAVGNRLFAVADLDGAHYLLEFDTPEFGITTDFSETLTGVQATSWTSNWHTGAHPLQMASQSRVYSDVTPDGTGAFATPEPLDIVEIGLSMPFLAELNAPRVATGQGPKAGKMQCLVSCEISWDRVETGTIGGQSALDALDNPQFSAPARVDEWRQYFVSLWDREPRLKIEGDKPGRMALRALVLNVKL